MIAGGDSLEPAFIQAGFWNARAIFCQALLDADRMLSLVVRMDFPVFCRHWSKFFPVPAIKPFCEPESQALLGCCFCPPIQAGFGSCGHERPLLVGELNVDLAVWGFFGFIHSGVENIGLLGSGASSI